MAPSSALSLIRTSICNTGLLTVIGALDVLTDDGIVVFLVKPRLDHLYAWENELLVSRGGEDTLWTRELYHIRRHPERSSD